MVWFRCDNDGNIVIDMKKVAELLKNNSLPNIIRVQDNILQAIEEIADSNIPIEIPEEQLNQILSVIQAIPYDIILENQNDIKSMLEIIKSNTDSMTSSIHSIYGELEDFVIGTLTAGETEITLTSDGINNDTNIDIYTSKYGVMHTNAIVSTGKVTLTFEEQSEDIGVKIAFKRAVDWEHISVTTIDGIKQSGTTVFKFHNFTNESRSTLPYTFTNGSMVMFNNEIHILGGIDNGTKHYKFDGSEWTEVSTLPYEFINGSAVVYNNEIHIMGGGTTNTEHYKFDGSEWTEVSTLPYEFINGSAIVYSNNKIHILGSSVEGNCNKHYKYNGFEWVSVVSELPYDFYNGDVIIVDNELHILGGTNNGNKHYKYDGFGWVEVSTLPYDFVGGSAILHRDKIHILGSNTNTTKHCKFNGSSWVNSPALPYAFANGSALTYDGEVSILGNSNNHYLIDVEIYEKKLN